MFIDKNINAAKLKKNNKSKNLIRPPLSGIYNIRLKNIDFDVLTINSDDTSVSDRYWAENHKDPVLEKWAEWSEQEGIFLDVGAHTGFYTIASLKANQNNYVVSIEPLPINYFRVISNLRLNNFDNSRVSLYNAAVSNETKTVSFLDLNTQLGFLSKGAKISEKGFKIQAIQLDKLDFSKQTKMIRAIKIDTEGEDLNVIYGAKNLIVNHKPKIVVETRINNFTEIYNFLMEIGYSKIYDINEKSITRFSIEDFKDNFMTKDIFFEY